MGGDGGLKTASVLMSLCATANRHGLNPWLYLKDLLDQLATKNSPNRGWKSLADRRVDRHVTAPDAYD